MLEKKLTVIAANMDGENYIGLYEKIEDQKYPSRYTHSIKISKSEIDIYFKVKDCSYNTKTCVKENIRKIVRHELIHALTNEIISDWTTIEGANRDSSPFFLTLLYWLGGSSNHNCVQAFKRSQIYHETKYIKTFDLLYMYLSHKLSEYEKITSDLDTQRTNDSIISNKFSFAHRDAGLLGNYTIRCCAKDLKTGIITYAVLNDLQIGCCIMPQDIGKYLIKRCNNNNFTYFECKTSFLKDNYVCTIQNGKLNKVEILIPIRANH